MKNTDDLRQELMDTPNLSQYLQDNEESFDNSNISAMLNALFQKRSISKAALARLSGMSEVYLHQVFNGRRNPSRSRLLCICFGLGATAEETQELLKHCGHAQLYPRNRRDAIILFGLANGLDLFEVNDKLFTENEETLF